VTVEEELEMKPLVKYARPVEVADARVEFPAVTAPRFEVPVTVREPRVPTLVRDEFKTEAPRVVAERMLALFTRKLPPVARFKFPPVMERPLAMVEVAAPVTARKPVEKVVEVAWVEEANTTVRLVMVEEALFTNRL